MKYRDLVRMLRAAGFTVHPGKGDHEKWTSSHGHHVTVRHQQEASPGVVRQVQAAIEREKQS